MIASAATSCPTPKPSDFVRTCRGYAHIALLTLLCRLLWWYTAAVYFCTWAICVWHGMYATLGDMTKSWVRRWWCVDVQLTQRIHLLQCLKRQMATELWHAFPFGPRGSVAVESGEEEVDMFVLARTFFCCRIFHLPACRPPNCASILLLVPDSLRAGYGLCA